MTPSAVAPEPSRVPHAPQRPSDMHPWARRTLRRLEVLDAAAVAVATAVAHLLRFTVLDGRENAPWDLPFWAVTVVVCVLWWIFLGLFNTRDLKVLGAGVDEYRRVINASLYLFGLLGLGAYLLLWNFPRGYFLTALACGTLLLLLVRVMARRGLVRSRRQGKASRRVLLLGGPSGVQHLHESLTSTPEAGYVPVVAALPGHPADVPEGQPPFPLPIASTSRSVSDLLSVVDSHDVDAVIMTDGSRLKTRALREIGWGLADRGVSHIMAPALTDISGPRIHQQPVAGTSLVHVTTPRFSRLDLITKRTMDIVGSGLLLVLLSPVFLAVVLAIKITDPGPVFFQHTRIGRNGEPFTMIKFRSMVVDAEARLQALREQQGAGALLFKMKDDPRITPFGKFIRRYSIDELPQLWNVFRGDMSLVGPRPQVQAEVDEYDEPAFRRLMVRPGMTGLWQVSGRSNLSADEAIRLDLYYVENWSPIFDFIILARTAKAVVAKDGAY